MVQEAAKKEESSENDSSNEEDEPAIKKMMNQHLKSKKLLQDLPTRIIMAAMTIKVQIKRVCS